jgi:hypothetical protein
MTEQIKPKTAVMTHQFLGRSQGADHSRELILISISQLQALSRRGLWGILLFLTLSAVTLYLSESGMLALAPAGLKELFGDLPPTHLIHLAMAVSWLSALVLIMGRVTGDAPPGYNWYNIGLPTAFYPLYVFADSGGAHFPVVFAAGLTLLIVEHVSVLFFASKAIREGTERISRLPN